MARVYLSILVSGGAEASNLPDHRGLLAFQRQTIRSTISPRLPRSRYTCSEDSADRACGSLAARDSERVDPDHGLPR